MSDNLSTTNATTATRRTMGRTRLSDIQALLQKYTYPDDKEIGVDWNKTVEEEEAKLRELFDAVKEKYKNDLPKTIVDTWKGEKLQESYGISEYVREHYTDEKGTWSVDEEQAARELYFILLKFGTFATTLETQLKKLTNEEGPMKKKRKTMKKK